MLFRRAKNQVKRELVKLLKTFEEPIPALKEEINRLKQSAIDIECKRRELTKTYQTTSEANKIKLAPLLTKLAKQVKIRELKVHKYKSEIIELEAQQVIVKAQLDCVNLGAFNDAESPEAIINDIKADLDKKATYADVAMKFENSSEDEILRKLGMSQEQIDLL